jgi:hypothetical protein
MGRVFLVIVAVTCGCGGAPASSPTTPSPTTPSLAVSAPSPAAPSPAALSPRALEPVRAEIVAQHDGRPTGTSVGWDGEREYVALGLPARSTDGRTVVLVEGGGDGTSSRRALVTLTVATGALDRRDELYASDASEEGTPLEAARAQDARARIAEAQRHLARAGFLALEPLGSSADAAGALALEEPAPGVVQIRDATGRTRFREVVVPPAPTPPPGLDDDALDEWELEHQCDDSLEEAQAWRIDAGHVLLVLRVGATPDECWVRDEPRIVTLSE